MSISQNTTELQSILETINNLPEAGSGGGVTITGEPGEYVVIGSDGNPTTVTAPIQYGTTEVQDGDPSPYPNGTLYIVISE